MATPLVTGDADVLAVLADPRYLVPPVPAAPATEPPAEAGPGTRNLTWLRATVSRFSEGQVHDRRRALVERELADLDPARLRQEAARLTAAELTAWQRRAPRDPFNAMLLARRVPLAVLGAELGLTGNAAIDAAIAASGGYLNPGSAGPDADASVAYLVQALGPAEPEVAANRIGLLAQACDATAGLIGNALARAFDRPATADEVVAATLRTDPPVRRTRRLTPNGDVILVDISGHPFGAGRRPCPGVEQAVALAAGVLEALMAVCGRTAAPIAYPDSPNLRVPETLFLTFR
jgi:cytochrome P450